MTDEEIKQARAVIEAATPGPWRAPKTRDGSAHVTSDERMIYSNRDTAELHEDTKAKLRANATFTAAARTGWPAALDALENYQRRLEFYKANYHDHVTDLEHERDQLKAEVEQLKAEQRLNEPDFTRLKAEVERLRNLLDTEKACHNTTAAEVERLRGVIQGQAIEAMTCSHCSEIECDEDKMQAVCDHCDQQFDHQRKRAEAFRQALERIANSFIGASGKACNRIAAEALDSDKEAGDD